MTEPKEAAVLRQFLGNPHLHSDLQRRAVVAMESLLARLAAAEAEVEAAAQACRTATATMVACKGREPMLIAGGIADHFRAIIIRGGSTQGFNALQESIADAVRTCREQAAANFAGRLENAERGVCERDESLVKWKEAHDSLQALADSKAGRLRRLETALQPFADAARSRWLEFGPDERTIASLGASGMNGGPTVGDCRRARAALAEEAKP